MPRATPEAVGMSSERLQAATALLRQFVADRKIAGAVAAVARRGKIVYLEPVGLQSLESRAPMTERSLFRIYSMTKAVTAVAVMMLVEEGKLQLTDPASKYLPEFKNVMVQEGGSGAPRPPSREITIQRSAAAHLGPEPPHVRAVSTTAGALARRSACRSSSSTSRRRRCWRIPARASATARPRPCSAGSSRCVSKQSFDAFVTTRILQPLGMSDTSVLGGSARRGRASPRCISARQDGTVAPFEIEEVPFTEKPALMEGAVGLVSTAEDFIRFSQMLLNKGELGGVRCLKADDRRVDDGERAVRADAEGEGRQRGLGSRQRRRGRRRRIARLPDRRSANTGGTDRPGRSLPLIPRRSWSSP